MGDKDTRLATATLGASRGGRVEERSGQDRQTGDLCGETQPAEVAEVEELVVRIKPRGAGPPCHAGEDREGEEEPHTPVA